jgi:outer membrane receptor for Fe3+-dicitrate
LCIATGFCIGFCIRVGRITKFPKKLGNTSLKPEKTKEFEIGIETKLFDNRLGFEVSYYNRDITDMLVPLGLSPSSGTGSIWLNAGAMTNKGLEVSLYGTPIQTKDFALMFFFLEIDFHKIIKLLAKFPDGRRFSDWTRSSMQQRHTRRRLLPLL